MKTCMMIILSILSYFCSDELDKRVSAAIRSGDIAQISDLFISSVRMSIHGEDQFASRSKAEFVLADYVKKNKIVELKKKPSLEDRNTYCLIYDAKANKRNVRILVKLVKMKNSYYISEIIIE